MSMRAQVERLVAAGVPDVAGVSADEFRELAADLTGEGVLCVHPELAGPSQLAPLLRRGDRPGFVVADMDDLDAFDPIESVVFPIVPSTSCTGSTVWTTCSGGPPTGHCPRSSPAAGAR